MDSDVKEASEALLKLEEARILLNKLMGPGGSLTEKQREKYLKNAKGAGSPEAMIGAGPSGGPFNNIGMTAPSNKALQNVNQASPYIHPD